MALRMMLFCFLICSGSCVLAQDTTAIYGVIVDTANSPLESGFIRLENENRKFGVGKDGYFKIELEPNKFYIVEIGAIGYYSKSFSVILKPGEQRRVEAILNISSLRTLIVPGRLVLLEPLTIPEGGRVPTPTDNFEGVLNYTALGLSSTNELSSTYNVRGGNYDENLIYVNDILIYRPFLVRSGQQEGLSFIHSDLVDHLQFSAGGFDAMYGDKLSSVLDIHYRDPKETKASFQASLMGVHIHLEGLHKNRKLTYLLGARYRNNSYLLNSLQTKGDYRPVFGDAQTLIGYGLNDHWRLEFLGHYSSNKYRVVPENRETAFGVINEAKKFTVYFDGQEVTQFETATGALSFIYDSHRGTNIKFITSAFRSVETESFDVQGQYFIDDLETDLGSEDFGETTVNEGIGTFLNHARNRLDVNIVNAYIRGKTILSRHQNHQILYGVTAQKEFFNDQISEWRLLDSAGFSIPQRPSDIIQLDELLKAQLDLRNNRLSGYIQDVYSKSYGDSITVFDTTIMSYAFWNLSSGVRAVYLDQNNQTVVSPRFKISYIPRWYYKRGNKLIRRDAELRFATGFYYQPPLYREFRTFDGSLNTNVLAQRSIHFVLGGHTTFDMWNRPFKFVSEIYYKHLDFINPYEIENVRIRYHAENKASGYAAGIDFKLNGEFVKGIESWAKLSLLKTMENIYDDQYTTYYNSDGEEIFFGYTQNDTPTDSTIIYPGNIPRPADQRVFVGLFFQDEMPRWPSYKVQLSLIFGSALPYGPPDHDRYKDVLRTPPYRRVDIGFSKDLLTDKSRLKNDSFWRNVESMWISLEVFNLLGINNTISYTWIKDVNNFQQPIPNYLTGRRLNLKFVCHF